MVGGGSRRDDGALGIRSNNVFSALEALKKKKKSDKDSKSKGSSKSQANKEPEPQVFWAPAPLIAKSWADVDDDDDYYATTAPPQSVWGASDPQKSDGSAAPLEEMLQESESEDEGLDEGDDDVDEEHENEHEVPVPAEPDVRKPPTSLVPKDTERQLSKKELKKKELAELEAVLAELGISGNDSQIAGQDNTKDVVEAKKSEEHSGNDEKKGNGPAASESKTSKKKKAKKDKSLKEAKDQPEHQPDGSATDGPDEVTEATEDDTLAVDVKERLKKVASMKKKKSSKEMDAAGRAAAIEAAARSAKLAAAKRKEKNHYNQQPVR